MSLGRHKHSVHCKNNITGCSFADFEGRLASLLKDLILVLEGPLIAGIVFPNSIHFQMSLRDRSLLCSLHVNPQ